MKQLYQFSTTKLAWLCLTLSALALLVSALYFQHVLDLAPCIKCIYQRTAVIGIAIAGLLPLIINHIFSRILGFGIWAYSAFQGLVSAREHLDVINASNPFFSPCEIVPNFPSFLPLHEWIPAVFGATGECNDDKWQFFGMGMAAWMQIIFCIYIAVLVLFVIAQFFKPKHKQVK